MATKSQPKVRPPAAMLQMDINNPYFQQFQAGMTPPMGLFPVFPGVPMGAMPPAPGVAMPAPAPANPAAPTEEAKSLSEGDAPGTTAV